MDKKLREKIKKIKLVATDVDGVLTDGGMYYSSKGDILKKFQAVDGMAVSILKRNTIPTVIITKEMVAKMNQGSVLVDQAVASGGNIEGSKINEEVITESGARIIGIGNLESCIAHDASQVYASNLTNLIEHFWDGNKKCVDLNLQDDILKNCLLTHKGQVIHEALKAID